MTRNLKKGSKVFVTIGFPGEKKKKNRTKLIPGVVTKKFTVRKGSVNVDKNNPEARTLVHVRAAGNIFSKRPSQLKRRK